MDRSSETANSATYPATLRLGSAQPPPQESETRIHSSSLRSPGLGFGNAYTLEEDGCPERSCARASGVRRHHSRGRLEVERGQPAAFGLAEGLGAFRGRASGRGSANLQGAQRAKVSGGYDAFDDPYAYKNSDVLRNKAGLRDAALLEAFELEMTALRAEEALPFGRYGPAHYRAVHRHLFQDVYSWAGRYRTVRTAKSGNVFCYPEHIAASMVALFARLQTAPFTGAADFGAFAASAADFLAELNAIHPFREGNGRCQLTFLHLIAERAGHPLDLRRVEPVAMILAMVASFRGDVAPLIG
ncbi:MAG: Fic family protein [Proteobacteria bacterium]|nr:Fic family protein [Pseudomonadota bacterium]